MKKLVSTILIAFALLGSATVANAQSRVIVANPDWAYDHCRENVLRGDEELRRGAYNTAEWYYKLAMDNNRDCPVRKYISDHELERKLDDVQFARTHNGMSRREVAEKEEREAQRALVSAIAAAAQSRNNNKGNADNNGRSRNNAQTSSDVSTELQHFDNNGVSYDANTSNVKITGVERGAKSTTVHFEFLNLKSASSLTIGFATYLKDKATGKKLILQDTDGIYTNNSLHIEAGDSHDFTLTFPAVSADCHTIDIVEPGETGWKFYHIAI